MSAALPEQFSALAPFIAKWALATEYQRAAERRRSTTEELKSFYDTALPLLPAMLARADKYPLGEVEGVDRQLFHMALSLAEIAPHVEFYRGDARVPFAFEEERLAGFHCDRPD